MSARVRGSVAKVVERDHASDRAVRDLGAGRRGQELVHRAALVGSHVSEGDPPQPSERNDAGNR